MRALCKLLRFTMLEFFRIILKVKVLEMEIQIEEEKIEVIITDFKLQIN